MEEWGGGDGGGLPLHLALSLFRPLPFAPPPPSFPFSSPPPPRPSLSLRPSLPPLSSCDQYWYTKGRGTEEEEGEVVGEQWARIRCLYGYDFIHFRRNTVKHSANQLQKPSKTSFSVAATLRTRRRIPFVERSATATSQIDVRRGLQSRRNLGDKVSLNEGQ